MTILFTDEQKKIAKEEVEKLNEAAKASGSYPDPNHAALPVFLPSHDNRSMLQTIMTVNHIGLFLQRPIITASCGGLGQAVAMNGMVRNFQAMCARVPDYGYLVKKHPVNGKSYTRALWIEDDIELAPGQASEIANMITKADELGLNIVTPYSTGYRDDGQLNWVYFKKPQGDEIGRPYTAEEIRALQPFDKVDLGGLGFYYGDIYLDYVWYEGTYNGHDRFNLPSYSGIDWNYFLDNNVELSHYPIFVRHEKTVGFVNVSIIENWGKESTMPKMIVRPESKAPTGSPEDRA